MNTHIAHNGDPECPEVIVKIDHPTNNNNITIWRDNSYDLWVKHNPSYPLPEPDANNNNNNNNVDSSEVGFEFPVMHSIISSHDEEDQEDPPSKLISQFINKQRASGVDIPFDVDFPNYNNAPTRTSTIPPIHDNNNNNSMIKDDDSCHHLHHKTPSKDIFQSTDDTHDQELLLQLKTSSSTDGEMHSRAIYNNNTSSYYQKPTPATGTDVGGGGEVLRCTSFQRKPSILRTKTQSRLMDPHEPDRDHRCKFSGQVNNDKSSQSKYSGKMNRLSGMLGRKPPASVAGDDEEDDFLLDEDIPDEYRKGNRNALTVVQWVSLLLIVAALICTLVIPEWKNHEFKGLQLWKWEMLILILICGRLVSGWGIRLIVFFVERNFLLRKRVLYFVYGVRKAVQNCIWLGLVLLAWHFLFDKRIEKETNSNFLKFFNKLLFCFLVGSLLWLVKTLMVKVLASSFHVSTFFDRIQESLFNQYVIETLSGPPVIELQHIQEDEERTIADIRQLQSLGINVPPDLRATAFTPGAGLQKPPARTLSKKFSRVGSSRKSNINNNNNKHEQGIPIDNLHRWNHKNISAWNMKRLMKIVRNGVLSTLDEQIHESTNGDESSTQICSELQAKAAARKIFQNVTRRGSKYIYMFDLMRFMRQDEGLKTMALLAGSAESEKISKSALKGWVVNAFRERKALALTLNDTKTAVNKLHQMVNILVGIIIVVVCLVILGFATSKVLLFISSQIVVVAFVFGNTCKTVFEAIIFLFVMHPFDVGDRCEIDGVQMIVEEMNILNTIFLRFDNQKIFYPNSTLSTKAIGNYYRSPDMGDSVDFHIHITTPAEKIAMMRQRIISYIESKKDYWYSAPSVVLMNLEGLQMVKMSVWIRHRMNHQDMGEKWSRRALLVEEMIKTFKEFDIEYRLIPHDINVRTMPTLSTTRTPPSWVSPDKR